MNTAYAFALSTIAGWTISIFILAKLSRLVLPALLNKASLFFSIFLLGFVVCIVDKISPVQIFTIPNASNWFWLGLSGILGKTIGDYCGFVSLRILGARQRSMLTTLTPGFTWLFALLLLQERINAWGVAGMLLTMVSLFLLLREQPEKKQVKIANYGDMRWGVFMGVAGALLTAIAFVFSKKTYVDTGRHISEFHGTWIRIIVAFTAAWLIDIIRNKNHHFISEIVSSRRKSILLFFGILFGSILALSFSLMTITRMEVAVAYTLFSLTPLVVILASVFVFGKKISSKSWLYSLLSVIGVMLLVWRNSISF